MLVAIVKTDSGKLLELLLSNKPVLEELEATVRKDQLKNILTKQKRLPWSSNAKIAIEMALMHMQDTGHSIVTPTILLLGILTAERNKTNTAIDCLKAIGADVESMRQQLRNSLKNSYNKNV